MSELYSHERAAKSSPDLLGQAHETQPGLGPGKLQTGLVHAMCMREMLVTDRNTNKYISVI